ncbi:MAG: tRNA (N6-isopentenyl adenosine(37)-C2)-methylthiotransferase MiaB [Alphaproteobacteria bacterium]|nr:tRNA (N6-isopentenyl adenosine(37)-C2)-methylthiotransferase MiaB [Alphaproteobacteria bacterium]
MSDVNVTVTSSFERKVFIRTYGCQMNVYDSDRMSDLLEKCGYHTTVVPEEADLVILNTCHIREKATERIYSEVDDFRAIKQKRFADGQSMLIAVAGCVAQAEGEEILHRAPVVDMVFGPQLYHRLPDLLERAGRGEKVVELDFTAEDKFASLPKASQSALKSRGRSAFLTVQEGCDKFCTFCVVPYTRGMEVSRPVADIVEEARGLAESGVVEIVLLGQNVNAYHGIGPHGRTSDLADLLGHLAALSGISYLRYVTSHPSDMSESLIAAHGSLPELVPYLHLPVQSGSDRILNGMNRKYSAQQYVDIIGRLRISRPDIALASDFIVGFPGESDTDFEATMSLVREVGFAQAYSFRYSARPGTPAARMKAIVPEPVKKERLAALQGELSRQQWSFNEAFMGRVLPILLDRNDRRSASGRLGGRSPYGQTVYVDAPASLYGCVCPVRITGIRPNGLLGVIDEVSSPFGGPAL